MPPPLHPSPSPEGTLLHTFDPAYEQQVTKVARDHDGPLPSPGRDWHLAAVVPITDANGATMHLRAFWERSLPNDPPDPGKVGILPDLPLAPAPRDPTQ